MSAGSEGTGRKKAVRVNRSHLQRSAADRLEVPNATGSIAGLEPAVEPAVAVCRESAAVIEGAVAA
jgi:hypothetical protein